MDASRLRTGELVAGGGGIAMFVFLFFDWFGGGAELTGSVGNLTLSQTGVSGWDALTDLPGFLIILSAVSGIALACLAAAGQRVNIPVRRGGVTATLGSLAVLLILWRMVAGSPTLKIGVFLGLAAAIAIAVGALMALAEDGFRPLVAVAGARTTVAAASAPPTTPAPPPASAVTRSKTRSSGGSRSRGSTTKKRSTTKSRSSNTKKRATPKKSTTKRSSTKKSSSRSSANTRSRSTRSTTAASKRTKSTRSTSGKKSSSAKSRPSGRKK